MSRLLIFLFAAPFFAADPFTFQVARTSQVVAEIEMRSPGADWGRAGREAAVATLLLDGRFSQHVMLFAGEQRYGYRVFLGELPAGSHKLDIERDAKHSAGGAMLEVLAVKFREVPPSDPEYAVLASAPVLFARANTIGKFTDIPLLTYCERLIENGRPLLQYSVIFSNEDGGTSTRALMARWGRATDIEYIYKVGGRATIQTRDHQEVEYTGPREGLRPLLLPVTDNNMVAGEAPSAIRYQLAPILVDLSRSSREKVMDDQPITWQVMGQELVREGKLRPYDTLDGEKISDPRNYLYIDYQVTNRDSRSIAMVKLRGENKWRSSDLGRLDYGIDRSGWVRTTIELPPGTSADRIAEIGFACRGATGQKLADLCRIESVSKAFLLDRDYRPGAAFWSLSAAQEVRSGEIAVFPILPR